MYRDHTIAAVIPAYNEEGFVGQVIEEIPAFVDRCYVVDDASTDGTWEEIRAHAAGQNDRSRDTAGADDRTSIVDPEYVGPGPFDERVVTIQHLRNRGAGGAIKSGYLRALEDGIDVTVTVDGDGQTDLTVIDELLDPIVEGRADYTKGNRLLSRHRGQMPRLRFVGNVVLGALTRIASGYWETSDPQTGFTAISRRALAAIDVGELYEFYGYPNDVLVRLNVAGMRVLDVPCQSRYGIEESHIRYRTYVPRVSWMLLRNFLWRLRTKYLVHGFHPLVFVYLIGTVAMLAGVAGLVATVTGGLADTTSSAVTAFSSATLLVVAGGLSWAWAMVLDREANAGLDGTAMSAGELVGREGAPVVATSRADDRLDRPVVDGGREAIAVEVDEPR